MISTDASPNKNRAGIIMDGVNTQLRGSVVNPFTTFGVNRIAAGQSITSGLNATLYRTLSLIEGGDYTARVGVIRSRLNELYGLGL